jgi:hypothetical protein
MAEVRLNGKKLGILWNKPYRIEVNKALQPGLNTLEIDVTNLWVNRLIGDEQFTEDCDWGEGKYLTHWPCYFALCPTGYGAAIAGINRVEPNKKSILNLTNYLNK